MCLKPQYGAQLSVQISGIDGAKGADGLDMEFVYTRTKNEKQVPGKPKWKDETNTGYEKGDYKRAESGS